MRLVFVVAWVVGTAAAAGAQPTPPPPQAQAYYEFLLARRLESQGDATGALAALNRAQTLDPRSAEVLAELAGFHARQNNGEDAVTAAEKALTIDPANVEAHRMLGLVFAAWSEGGGKASGGRSPADLRTRAIEHLTKIMDTPLVATDLNLQLTLARLHLRAGNAGRAVPILENIVSQAPFAAEPYTLLAEARLSLGRVDGAIEALEMAAEINPRHYVTLADLYERRGRWKDAATAYEAALANPRIATRDLRLRFFTALINADDTASAIKARDGLKDFLVTSPQDARGLFLLSTVSLSLGDLPAAEAVARTLLGVDPTSVPALHALSAALVARQAYQDVITLLAPFAKDVSIRAKGRESDAALLLSQLAHAHTELGQHDEAVTALTVAVATDPMSGPALNSLGYTLAERGERLTEAVAFIERALKVEPDNPSYLDSLGWALFKQGRVQEAEGPLRKAADQLPKQSVIQDHYGDVLSRLQRVPEAIRAWERALAGDGEDVNREAILKKIKDARGQQ